MCVNMNYTPERRSTGAVYSTADQRPFAGIIGDHWHDWASHRHIIDTSHVIWANLGIASIACVQ